jgi:hypothetical protein
MSTNPERAVSYVLNKYVTNYMDKDVLLLGEKLPECYVTMKQMTL